MANPPKSTRHTYLPKSLPQNLLQNVYKPRRKNRAEKVTSYPLRILCLMRTQSQKFGRKKTAFARSCFGLRLHPGDKPIFASTQAKNGGKRNGGTAWRFAPWPWLMDLRTLHFLHVAEKPGMLRLQRRWQAAEVPQCASAIITGQRPRSRPTGRRNRFRPTGRLRSKQRKIRQVRHVELQQLKKQIPFWHSHRARCT